MDMSRFIIIESSPFLITLTVSTSRPPKVDPEDIPGLEGDPDLLGVALRGAAVAT